MKKQDFKVLKTKDLYPFPDNPFHVAEDETLSELAESIKEFGIVTPIITRPKEDGDGYEVIAGQRRVRASELAGINTVPAFVLPLDRDRAIITLVDSNLQRENILPSERAFAYKMKSEAMKRQGFRTDLTSSQVVTKLRTDDKVAVAALAEPLVEVVLTDKWLPAVPYLQILCIAFMWDPVMKINHSVLNVKGRTDYFLYAEIWKKLIAFAILFATIPLGVSAMCWGLVLYSFADMGVIICYSRKLMKAGYLRQLCELLPVLLLNGAMGMCLYLITLLPLSAWGQLLLGVPSGLIIYVVGSCVFHMSEWQMLLSVLNKSGGRSSLSSE